MTRACAIGVLALGLSATVAAGQQAPASSAAAAPSAPAPVEAPAAAGAASGSDAAGAAQDASGGILLPPHGYTYKAEGRRDPFVTLVKRGSDAMATTAAARAAGLAGLNTGEVSLRGTLASQGGYVAMLLGSDEKTYIVREGDKLADGMIRAITADTMVILQQVKDPLSLQKQREVRKLLRHVEGTN